MIAPPPLATPKREPPPRLSAARIHFDNGSNNGRATTALTFNMEFNADYVNAYLIM
jgi:hypothetical protein